MPADATIDGSLINAAILLEQQGCRAEAIQLYEDGIRRRRAWSFTSTWARFGFPKSGRIAQLSHCRGASSLRRLRSGTREYGRGWT